MAKKKVKIVNKPKARVGAKQLAKALGAEPIGPLTVAQIEELAGVLIDTGQNVYRVVERLFSIKVGEEIFALLEKVGEIFKCEECNTWLSLELKDPDVSGFCTPCANRIDEHEE